MEKKREHKRKKQLKYVYDIIVSGIWLKGWVLDHDAAFNSSFI